MAKRLMLKNDNGFAIFLHNAYAIQGKTMKQIADEMGCSPATILNHLRRLGIPIRKASSYFKGVPRPEHVKAAISKSNKGRIFSEEHRRKISESKKKLQLVSPNWRGGRRAGRSDGYIQIFMPKHPFCSKEGYVMEHRLVMEKKINRYLSPQEVVHHIDHNRRNNDQDNLLLFESASAHQKFHHQERIKYGNQ